jgi:D-3-phosphoglycerate dehydrogenase
MAVRVAIGPSSFAEEDDAPLRRLRTAGCEVVPNALKRRLTEAEIIAHLEGVDGLIAGLEPLNANVFAAAKHLRAIARVGIGMDNVDVAAAKERGIKVSNTPDGPTLAVAELTMAAMLALCRRLVTSNAALHAGEWKKQIGIGLDRSTVLVVGFGRIGRRVAELSRAFGARVMVHDPMISDAALPAGLVYAPDLLSALPQADIVTLHAGTTETIMNEKEFGAMRDGAILLNSARGELVNEPALVSALNSGKVSGAWYDAFTKEPYSGPLTKFDQVLLTPHVATYTRQCRLSMESAAVENLLRDLGKT